MFCVCVCVGYLQTLSGKLVDLSAVAPMQKDTVFFGTTADAPWTDPAVRRIYPLTFPFYPFRTIHPRELALLRLSSLPEGEDNAPLIPGRGSRHGE